MNVDSWFSNYVSQNVNIDSKKVQVQEIVEIG